MKNSNALIIIAKYPNRETVKTRLKGLMPDEKRLELYITLLEQTVRKLKAIPGVDTFIAFAPRNTADYFIRFGVNLIALPEGDLGERMFYAFRKIISSGYKKASLVGADIPALSGAIIQKSFELLSDKDIVYGPAKDGGYYLVGMSKLVKEIFENVPWSSEVTLKKSIEEAERHGYSVAFTEALSDIDTFEDVQRAGFSG
jgi:rSAM/selenodomain-associated transferase 1